jgi:hypothetical protein
MRTPRRHLAECLTSPMPLIPIAATMAWNLLK